MLCFVFLIPRVWIDLISSEDTSRIGGVLGACLINQPFQSLKFPHLFVLDQNCPYSEFFVKVIFYS